METTHERIAAHYGPEDIGARILARLEAAGRDTGALTREDLAPFDEFHGGGLASTRAMARFAGVEPGTKVLDLGSGIGGPARTLAAEFGCEVTGVDLTAEFVRAARMLTERLGMADRVSFHHGDATRLPFPDHAFDLVWSQNTIMNIEDKGRLFAEAHRVLRPGGRLAFEALLAGEGEPYFPAFWAATPELSFLAEADEVRALLGTAGFEIARWDDSTGKVVEHAHRRLAALERDGPAPLAIDVIVPAQAGLKMRNSLRSNEEGRTRAVQVRCVRPA